MTGGGRQQHGWDLLVVQSIRLFVDRLTRCIVSLGYTAIEDVLELVRFRRDLVILIPETFNIRRELVDLSRESVNPRRKPFKVRRELSALRRELAVTAEEFSAIADNPRM